MKCFECGGEMIEKRERVTDHHLGLESVVLKNALVRRCKKCGEREIVFEQIASLHRLIATTLIQKTTRLVGTEIRYLRKYLGWSSKELARRLGVACETLSRWENGHETIGPQADRLLRVVVAYKQPTQDYNLERSLEAITAAEPTITSVNVKIGEAGYELAIA